MLFNYSSIDVKQDFRCFIIWSKNICRRALQTSNLKGLNSKCIFSVSFWSSYDTLITEMCSSISIWKVGDSSHRIWSFLLSFNFIILIFSIITTSNGSTRLNQASVLIIMCENCGISWNYCHTFLLRIIWYFKYLLNWRLFYQSCIFTCSGLIYLEPFFAWEQNKWAFPFFFEFKFHAKTIGITILFDFRS